ncbi:MAG: ATP-grasp domain-containing protein [Gammaproteobacteria bacterium]|nr:ATP-grasp domain-containing protein [Gammaproteobacteria bacterium]
MDEWLRLRGDAGTLILPGSGLEAEPETLDWLQQYGAVAANTAATVKQMKDPARFFPLLDRLGIRHPPLSPGTAGGHDNWLCKPIGGEGGAGIRRWPVDQTHGAGCYLQRYDSGRSVSVVFITDGQRARLVGFNHCITAGELNGDDTDFRFAEMIRLQPPPALEAETAAIVSALVRASGLRGLCGMDMLWDGDGISVLELNPRPPASFELHEDNGSLVAAHLAACAGTIPQRAIAAGRTDNDCTGKRIVYCPQPVRIPDGFSWPDWSRDRPAPGIRLEAGAPLCTILIRAATAEACRVLLRQHHDELLNNIMNASQHNDFNNFKPGKEVTA